MAASMIASAATGAALEVAFGTFIRAVLQLKKDNVMFKPILEALQHTANSIQTSIKRIDSFNRDFDRVNEIDRLKHLLERGGILLDKCKKVNKYNIIKKQYYVRKLYKLEEDLKRFIGMEMQVQLVADQKETLFEVKNITTQVSNMSNSLRVLSLGSSINGGGSMKGSFGLVGGCSPPEPKVDPVGLEIPLKDLKNFVIGGDLSTQSLTKTPLIVVSAPGGCGKTTLALTLCNDSQVKGKFKENIFYFTVSKQFNLTVIIQRLFQHHGLGVPDFLSEEDALNQLEALLKHRGEFPKLLVLDDVWAGSEFVIEKLAFRINNYKILVTSRYEFPTFGSTYKLLTLNDTDAKTLFCQLAFPAGGNSNVLDPDDLDKLVKFLKGYPLAISVIAKSLCRKPAVEWRKRINDCKTASILSESSILECLQTSVEALNEKPSAKECFKDLGSFPEDHKIPAPALIDMWVELHELDVDDAILNLHELSNRNLLDLVSKRKIAGEDDGIYNEHFVTQHDLLRELAIKQSDSGSIETRKRLFMDMSGIHKWKEQKQLLVHASLLSICTGESFRPSDWCSMEAPEVEGLVLNFYANNNYTLPEFMQSMTKLKVLLIINSDFFPSDLRNFHIMGSLSNLKRMRLEKVSIPSDLFGSVRLSNLEKISLVMCNVDQAFSNVMTDISETFPNLLEINIDYCNDLVELPSGFCNLPLKWLSITNCHKLCKLPAEIGKLMDLEVLRLNSCTELSELPQTIGKLGKLRILDLSDCLSITTLPETFGELSNLRKLYMIDCSNCELPDSVIDLKNLKEVIGDEETTDSWKIFQPYLTNLKTTVHKDVNLNWL